MSRPDNLAYLRRAKSACFEPVKPEDDYIVSRMTTPAGLENETYWFPFGVPDSQIIGNVYFWIHSQLRMASIGVMIWRGIKRYVHQAEHFNYHQFLPYPVVTDDAVFSADVGLRIRIVEPHVKHEVVYDDPLTKTSLRLYTRGAIPPVKMAGRPHFEQPMHVTGEMILNGVRYEIDCYSMRDRSWRGKRSEAQNNHPPLCYANGISNDGRVAFNFCGADDPDRGAPWAGRYDIAKGDLFLEGWVYRDGKLSKAVGMSRVAKRGENDSMRVQAWECALEEEGGYKHLIRAKTQAAMYFAPWYNIFCDWQQVRFEMEGGVVGHGVTNEIFWGDYARTLSV